MKKTIITAALFALLFIAQLAVPLGMAYESEEALGEGEIFRFKCDFYDPLDIFRGNYLRLRLVPLEAEYAGGIKRVDTAIEKANEEARAMSDIYLREGIFVDFETGGDGFAKVRRYDDEKSESLPNYLLSESARYIAKDNKIVFSSFGIEKFFVNEKDAPQLEAAIAKLNRDDEVYLVVALKNGRYVIKDMIIDGKTVRDVIIDARNAAREPYAAIESAPTIVEVDEVESAGETETVLGNDNP